MYTLRVVQSDGPLVGSPCIMEGFDDQLSVRCFERAYFPQFMQKNYGTVVTRIDTDSDYERDILSHKGIR